jgi:hypothetical protein
MTAKEMFEELGYEIYKGFCYIEYTKEKPINRYQSDSCQIRFYENDKKISVYQNLDLQELKAINKQIEELGWNNE